MRVHRTLFTQFMVKLTVLLACFVRFGRHVSEDFNQNGAEEDCTCLFVCFAINFKDISTFFIVSVHSRPKINVRLIFKFWLLLYLLNDITT